MKKERTIVETSSAARAEIGIGRNRPPFLEAHGTTLPFSNLSGDEFEVLCFLLLRAQYPNDRLYYFGKTKDQGRDIVHETQGGRTRLIQCKNFGRDVAPSSVEHEMAKVIVNVHLGKIPCQPDEVVFYVAADLSSQSQNLIAFQQEWLERCPDALKKYLKKAPDSLLKFAQTWWPFGDRQGGVAISDDVRRHYPDLIIEFFGVKKVIDGGVEEVAEAVVKKIQDGNKVLEFPRQPSHTGVQPPPTVNQETVRERFHAASGFLLDWPRTIGSGCRIHVPEGEAIVKEITSGDIVRVVLLGGPGSGKSALLGHLNAELMLRGIACLGIKADTLSTDIKSSAMLADRLGLPASIDACVRSLALDGPVVVLIDQLDALADLVDLQSTRLNVLLQLVNELSQIDGVSIIVSCRGFEFQHDSRLRTIKLQDRTLTLPDWRKVQPLLEERGLRTAEWPESFRELLRTPQQLKVFVDLLLGQTPEAVFTSYQQMLDRLWHEKVETSNSAKEKIGLLLRIAHEMSEREELWLPLAKFGVYRRTLDELIADGLLATTNDGFRFGFAHQTMLSHARARAFLSGDSNFVTFVKERQHALFVRPVVWSTLSYLRSADRRKYEHIMEELQSDNLRLHVHHLLLDFVGQVDMPTPLERKWFLERIDDSRFRRRALWIASTNPAWFRILQKTALPELMENPRQESWHLVSILASAIRQQPDDVIELVRRHWLGKPERDQESHRVYEFLENWGPATVDDVCKIIARSDSGERFANSIASTISEHAPTLAPAVVAAGIARQLELIDGKVADAEREKPKTELENWKYECIKRNLISDFLKKSKERYELLPISEAAPVEFIAAVWPFFTTALAQTLDEPHHIVWRFRTSHVYSYFDYGDDPDGSQNDLISSLQAGLQGYAQQQPRAFSEFVSESMLNDAMDVQRLLCRALKTAPQSCADVACEFLTSDSRRLALGDYEDEHADSKDLIAACWPHFTETQRVCVDACIDKWSGYLPTALNEEPQSKRWRMSNDRESRLRLRLAIPAELMDSPWQARLEAESVALPCVGSVGRRRFSGMRRVKSDMSAEQMALAKDEHLVRFLESTLKRAEDDVSRRADFQIVEPGRELEELAKTEPVRVAALIRDLSNELRQRFAGYVIRGLGESDLPSDRLIELINGLSDAGIDTDDFRDGAAGALEKRARKERGLPNSVCDLLQRWLGEWKYSPETCRDAAPDESNSDERTQSILFSLGGMISIPPGSYTFLCALTRGLLWRDTPATVRWMEVLEEHVERPDDPYVWKVFTLDLGPVAWAESNRGSRFFSRLFARFPSVLNSRFGCRRIIANRCTLGETAFRDLCNQIATSNWTAGPQAKGELFTASYLDDDEFQSIHAEVHEFCSFVSSANLQLRIGAAHAVGALWKNELYRSRCTTMFEVLSRQEHPEIDAALARVFLSENFGTCRLAQRILSAVRKSSTYLKSAADYQFCLSIEPFVHLEPELVLDLTTRLLDVYEQGGTERTGRSLDLADDSLDSIAMTLQRMDEPLRSAGLDLFERLLEFGFAAPTQTLHEVDARPNATNIPNRRRRRRSRNRDTDV